MHLLLDRALRQRVPLPLHPAGKVPILGLQSCLRNGGWQHFAQADFCRHPPREQALGRTAIRRILSAIWNSKNKRQMKEEQRISALAEV